MSLINCAKSCCLLFLFVAISQSLAGGELTTSFYLYRNAVTYPSLQAAEYALKTAPFIGSAFYSYQFTQGNERKYQHPPSTYFEDPKLVFTSQPWMACNDCPIFDQFGNDRCTSQTGGDGCASEENWWAAVQEVFWAVDCPPVKTGEGPWVEGTKSQVNYPMVFPEEYLMAQGSYTKFIDAELPEGSWSNCGKDFNFTLYATTPVYCQGYPTFQWDARAGEWLCLDYNTEEILMMGAPLAEPGNSCSVGNPCHPATGDKTLSETDFSSPTLPFSRHYHSLQIYPGYAAMGKGWSHTYSGRLLNDAGVIKVIDERGNAERFHCTDSPACSSFSSERESGHILRQVAGGWELYLKSGELRHFDLSGKLNMITERSGEFRRVVISYTPEGLVSLVTDQFSRALQFNYNDNKLVDSISLPDGQAILFDYAVPASDSTNNPDYNLVKVTYQDLSARVYHYADKDEYGADRYPYLLTGITDENGVEFASYSYDAAARVTSSEHAGGAGRIELNYTSRAGESAKWSITEVTLPSGEVVTYAMEPGPFRKITGIENSRGNVAMNYDPSTGWRTSSSDWNGNLSTYSHDEYHEIVRTEAAGTMDERRIETDWDDAVNRISERREAGQSTSYTYNTRGQVLTRTTRDTATQVSRSWTYGYFEAPALAPLIGRLKWVDGPRTDVNDVSNYEYYVSDHPDGDYVIGDLKAVVNALGHRTDYLAYDGNGRLLESRDANGVMTRMTYHARGWVKSIATDDVTTSFSYDQAGNLVRISEPDGNFTTYEYDAAHRLTAVDDRMGNRVEYSLDADGNRIDESSYDAAGQLRRQMSRMYDSLGRLTTLLDGNGDPTRFDYDGNGNRTGVTDANSHFTRHEYDGLDRLRKTVDSILGESVLSYDSRDNLENVSDPLGNVTENIFDGLDNQVTLTSPDTGATSYEHDPAGNRISSTDARGIRVSYDYDALDRLIRIAYPDSSLDVLFEYDAGVNAKGRLSRMVDATGSVDFSYSARGNLLTEVRSMGGNLFTTRYAYNNADRLVQVTYPSGMVVDYSLDAAGRTRGVNQTLDSVTFNMVNFVQYEPFGPVGSFTYGNGMAYEARYDPDYELDQLQSGDGLDWVMGFDPAGNLLAIDDQFGDQFDQVLSYDSLDRLTGAEGSLGSEFFEYDSNGNRLRNMNDFVDIAYSYEPGSNRLAGQNGWTLSRDAAGNRIAKLDPGNSGYIYSYADHNRLVRVESRLGGSDAVAGDYGYDGRGRRVSKTAAGDLSYFVYSPTGELLGEYDGNGDPVSEFMYLNGTPIAVHATQKVTPPSTLIEFVMDNDEPGTGGSGSWNLKSNKMGFGNDYRLGDKADTYRWTPKPIAGTFEVYAWWVSSKSYSGYARYSIRHGGLTDIVVEAHNQNGGDWQLLGSFTFSGSGDEYVELDSGDGKKVSADAIRFRQLDGGGETVTSEGTYFIHTDHLGTPRLVSNDDLEIIWRWNSKPFGNDLPDEDPDGDMENFTLNLRFPGQYYDAESGLHYNYFRTYDPQTGRYIESDPLGLRGGLNTFAYAGSNPTGYSDSYGLDSEVCRRPFYPVPVPYARHCFLRFSDGGSSSFGAHGASEDPAPEWWPKACQQPEGKQNDDCLKNAMSQCKANQYDFFGFNCCHCVEQAMNFCGMSIPVENWPNWPVNPGPQLGELGYRPDGRTIAIDPQP